MSKILTAAVGATALCAASAAAAATTISFTNPPANTVGTSHTYTDGSGHSVIATGYASNGGSTTNLYGKNLGGDEVGLGLNADPSTEHEIYKGAFIQLDVSSLGNVSSALFHFGSTTLGETWAVYGSNSAGSFNALAALLTGTNDEANHELTALSGWGTYKYYDFVSLGTKSGSTFNAGNVLLGNLSITAAVPEPATWAMMLIGFGAIGFSVRRRPQPRVAHAA